MRTLIITYPNNIAAGLPAQGKFLQLNLAAREYLLFAAADELRYHNQILARFLAEHGIAHHWQGVENLVVDHPGLTVIGGGRFRLDVNTQTLQVWDESSVYGRFDASLLAARLTAAGPPWDGLALNVR